MSSNGDSSEKNGFTMNLNGTKKKLPLGSKPKPAFFGNNRKRVELDGNDDDDSDDEDGHNRVELVQGFEGNKATELNPKEETKPLSIAPLANTDWRALARQKKQLYLPTRGMDPSLSASASTTPQGPEIIGQTVSTFGLQVPTTSRQITAATFDQLTETTVTTNTVQQDEPIQSLEAQAIEAIIQESNGGDNEREKGPSLVIPADETESFRNDVQNRAEDTTMEDYENVPVDEFGAALLRGLGWNQGEGIGRNRKNTTAPVMAPVKQRDALLGLGAKPQEVDKDNKKDDKKRRNRKADYDYKETSLFKKISKRRIDDKNDSNTDDDDYRSRRRISPSNDNNSSSRNSSRDRERSSSRSSSSSSRSSRDHRDYHKSGHRRSRSRSSSPPPPRRSGSHSSSRYSSNSSSRSSSKHYNDRPRD